MTLTGHSLIAGRPVPGDGKTTFGVNPASNERLEPEYTLLTGEQLTTATFAAAAAFESFSKFLKFDSRAISFSRRELSWVYTS